MAADEHGVSGLDIDVRPARNLAGDGDVDTTGHESNTMTGDPVYLEYQVENDEERFKVLGATEAGRILIAIWTPRRGKVRAITAYGASRVYQELYWESR